MAILRGFPPSNSINPTTYIPDIVETAIKIKELKLGYKFKTKPVYVTDDIYSEYCFLESFPSSDERYYSYCRAVCYLGNQSSMPGNIYAFDPETEVIWLKEVYFRDKSNLKDTVESVSEAF